MHAWTVRDGATALEAAGRVHTDMERGFIRAEVVQWKDLVDLGSEARCREAGKLRVEGKDYVIQDGDVVRVREVVSTRMNLEMAATDEMLETVGRKLQERGEAKPGDAVVVTGGIPSGAEGKTNFIKVHRI